MLRSIVNGVLSSRSRGTRGGGMAGPTGGGYGMGGTGRGAAGGGMGSAVGLASRFLRRR